MAEKLGMEVQVGANIKPLQKGLADAKRELAQTAIAAQRTDSSVGKLGASFGNAGGLVKNAASEIAGFGSSLLSGGIVAGVALVGAGLYELGRKLFDVTAEQKRLNDVLEGAKSAYVKAVIEVDKMRDAFQKAKDGLITKKEALKQYNTTIGKTIGQTDDLNKAEKLFIERSGDYVKYTFLRAAAQVAAAKAAEQMFEVQRNAMAGATKEGFFSKDNIARMLGGMGGFNDATRALIRAGEATKTSLDFKKISAQFNADAEAIADGWSKTVPDDVEKKIKHIRTIADVLADMNAQLSFLSKKEILFGTDEAKAKITALEAALDELLKKFKLGTDNKIIIDLALRIDKGKFDIDYKELLQRQDKGIEEAFNVERKPIEVKPKVVIKPNVVFDSANFTEEMRIELQGAIDAMTNFLTTSVVGGVTQIFDALGKVVTGKGGIGDIFEGLGRFLGSNIKQLGKQILQLAILARLAKLAAKNPITGIAAGIALIALGSAIESATAKNAFASGVRGFGGGVALVGERGPELVSLPGGSSVTPNNELNAYGRGGINLMPSLSYSGTDFRIFLNRVDAQMGRNG